MDSQQAWRQYVLPVVLVVLALVPTLWLAPLLERSTFLLFVGAVVLSSWIGGVRAGLMATALSVAAAFGLRASATGTRDDLVRLATFALVALWVTALSGRTQRLFRQLEKRADQLARSEEAYLRIAQLADEGMWTLDGDARTTYTNERLLRMLGRSGEEMRGQTLFDLVETEHLAAARDEWQRLVAGETIRFDLPLRRHDGETVWTRVAAAPIHDGRFTGAVAMVTDVTGQRRDRETRQESESLLRAVVDGTSDGVFVKDVAGRYLLINPAGAHALQRSVHEVLGRANEELLPASAARTIAAQERGILDSGEPRTLEFTIGEGDGERVYSATKAPYRDVHGRVVGLIGIARDVTERRRVEDERAGLLAEAERARRDAEAANRTKDEFLATLSHELRTPLTSIVGWAKMLRSGQLDPETARRAVETIDRNARLQTRLIADVLDLSRIVSGKLRLNLTPTELPPVLDAVVDIVRPAADAKGITLRKSIDVYPCPVSGDPDRLQQVVWNLLSNAIKFTARGGVVELRMACGPADAEIVVSDTGVGISPELLPHVFERFRQGDASSTRSYGGLGLGLAIARHLVELHGGRIEAESPGLGKGATFRLRLPRLLETVASVRASEERERRRRVDADGVPASEGATLLGLKVLIVDDEPDARELVATILEHHGAQVVVCDSVPQALAALERTHPDVLLSDVEMPGESGYNLIRKIRQLPPDRGGRVPAAALTAYARLEDRTRALRAGFQMHVPKPLNPTELTAVVASLAGRLEAVQGAPA